MHTFPDAIAINRCHQAADCNAKQSMYNPRPQPKVKQRCAVVSTVPGTGKCFCVHFFRITWIGGIKESLNTILVSKAG